MVFWGLLLLAIGANILLSALLGWNIPLLRIILGCFVIYLGVKIILGPTWNISIGKSKGNGNPSQVVMGESSLRVEQLSDLHKNTFSTVMGKGTLDLSAVEDWSGFNETIKIENVMGETIVILPEKAPFEVNTSNVLGGIEIPSSYAKTDDEQVTIRLKIENVMGRVVLRYPKI